MGSIIRSVAAFCNGKENDLVKVAARAADSVIKQAGLTMKDIGILINSSVYNEGNIREPALSSLVQKELEYPSAFHYGGQIKNTCSFSFDLHNGGGGVLSAIQVLDGFIRSGRTENGIIVTGDTKPEFGSVVNYTYKPGAAAILLSKGRDEEGFNHFGSDTYTEYLEEFSSIISWNSGEYHFEINEKESYLEHCLQCSVKSIFSLLGKASLSSDDIDLVLCSQSPPGFAGRLGEYTGLGSKVITNGGFNIYSAGIICSLDTIFRNDRYTKAQKLLFLSVGAGITVSTALYNKKYNNGE